MAPAGGGTKRKRNNNGNAPGPKSKKSRAKKVAEPDYGSEDDLDSAGEGEWIVDEILDKKIERGRTLYQLRWKNWDPNDLTWEPVDNLNCPDLIKKFENKLSAGPNGFSEGLTFRAIKGIVQLQQGRGEKLCYLVQFSEKEEVEKIPSSIVRDKVPQEVIKFLVSKIAWTSERTAADKDVERHLKHISRSKSNSESSHQVSHKSDNKENHHSDDDED